MCFLTIGDSSVNVRGKFSGKPCDFSWLSRNACFHTPVFADLYIVVRSLIKTVRPEEFGLSIYWTVQTPISTFDLAFLSSKTKTENRPYVWLSYIFYDNFFPQSNIFLYPCGRDGIRISCMAWKFYIFSHSEIGPPLDQANKCIQTFVTEKVSLAFGFNDDWQNWKEG